MQLSNVGIVRPIGERRQGEIKTNYFQSVHCSTTHDYSDHFAKASRGNQDQLMPKQYNEVLLD